MLGKATYLADLTGWLNLVVFKAQTIFASWSSSHFANIFQSCPRVCIRLGNAKWEKHESLKESRHLLTLEEGLNNVWVSDMWAVHWCRQLGLQRRVAGGNALCYHKEKLIRPANIGKYRSYIGQI